MDKAPQLEEFFSIDFCSKIWHYKGKINDLIVIILCEYIYPNERKVKIVLEVRRKDNESFESLVRRFTKKTIQSGKILQAKKVRFYAKPKTRRALKESALRRKQVTGKMDYLKKIGKLDETDLKKRKRK